MSEQISPEIEMLARMWVVCDPNRDSSTLDDPIEPACSSGANGPTTVYNTPLTGKPRWHWFIPRAEATVDYLKANGFTITARPE